jgi:hypothetical protein
MGRAAHSRPGCRAYVRKHGDCGDQRPTSEIEEVIKPADPVEGLESAFIRLDSGCDRGYYLGGNGLKGGLSLLPRACPSVSAKLSILSQMA